MTDYGIKVSQSGFPVLTTDDKNLSLASSINLLKVAFTGSIDVSSGSEVSVTHSLGYTPQFLVYISNTSGVAFLCSTRHVPGGAGSTTVGIVNVDTTKLYIQTNMVNPDTARYYIFYDQL